MKLKKILALLVTITIVSVNFIGCVPTKNDPNTIYIGIYNGGYGTDFIYELKKGFENKYPEIKVDIKTLVKNHKVTDELVSGKSNTDIYFFHTDMFTYLQKPMTVNGQTYDRILADLTDVYETVLPGETATLKDKLSSDFLDNAAMVDENTGEVKYYTLPWATGQAGLIINNKLWNNDWEIPNTTDELIMLAQQIKNQGKWPFIYCESDPYWQSYMSVWAAQYDGLDNVNAFRNGYAPDGNRYVPEIVLYEGLSEGLEVLEVLLKDSNKYINPYKSSDFTTVQGYFLEGDKNIVMNINGDWLEREARSNYSADEIDIKYIKAPVISSLGTQLGITDSELSQIIDCIDNNKTMIDFSSTKGLTNENVVERVNEARSLNISVSGSHTAWIPAYSSKVESAKKFLQYMATDEGIRAYVKGSQGYVLPYQYDYMNDAETLSYMSPFMKGVNKILINSFDKNNNKDRYYFFKSDKNPIFNLGGLRQLNIGKPVESYLAAVNPNDYKNAQDIFIENYEKVKASWQTIMLNSGLN